MVAETAARVQLGVTDVPVAAVRQAVRRGEDGMTVAGLRLTRLVARSKLNSIFEEVEFISLTKITIKSSWGITTDTEVDYINFDSLQAL